MHTNAVPMTLRMSRVSKKFSDPGMFLHQMNHPGTEPMHVSHEIFPMSYLCLLFVYTGIFPKKPF